MRNVLWREKLVLSLTCSGAMLLGFSGCLGFNADNLLRFGASYTATEFAGDNSAFPELDLFPEGGRGSGSGL